MCHEQELLLGAACRDIDPADPRTSEERKVRKKEEEKRKESERLKPGRGPDSCVAKDVPASARLSTERRCRRSEDADVSA